MKRPPNSARSAQGRTAPSVGVRVVQRPERRRKPALSAHVGVPRVIPVGFLWTGGHIVVSTAPTSPEEAKALLVRGLATLATVDGVSEEYLESARNSMDGDLLPHVKMRA